MSWQTWYDNLEPEDTTRKELSEEDQNFLDFLNECKVDEILEEK